VVAGLDVDRFAGDVDAGEVAADEDDSRSASWTRFFGTTVMSRATVPSQSRALVDLGLLGAETTSREASSILFGAYS
jgi:hypothetical protein